MADIIEVKHEETLLTLTESRRQELEKQSKIKDEMSKQDEKILEIWMETDKWQEKTRAENEKILKDLKAQREINSKDLKVLQQKAKAEEDKLSWASGMKSYALEMSEELKKQNRSVEIGLDLATKQALLNKMQDSYANGASEEAIDQGKGAKILYEMQRRLNDEVEAGNVMDRSKAALLEEYAQKMGTNLESMSESQRKYAEGIIAPFQVAHQKLSDMTGENLESLVNVNSQLSEMAGRWDKTKKGVTDVKDLVSGLLNNPALSASIFGYEVGKKAIELGKSFGDILNTGISVENVIGEMGLSMGTATLASLKYGASAKEVLEATKAITQEMGSIEHVTHENVKGAVKLMKLYDMDASSAAKITKQFSQIGKLTGQTNEELRSSVAEMANLSKVAPTAVFEDLSSNAEAMAKWLDASGKNMIGLSVSSRQLGLSMGDTLAMTEGILDFESSIEKQMAASVMTGRSFNFEQARTLAFAGDHEGALKNIVSQLGTEQEFLQMNAYQRQSMADMLNTSVDSLKDMIINQNKLGKETGKFSKFWEETMGYMKGAFSFVNKDNIIMMSTLVGTIKNLGMLDKIGGGLGKLGKGAGGLFGKVFKKGGAKTVVQSKAADATKSKVGAAARGKDIKTTPATKGVGSKVTKVDKSGGKGGVAGWIKSWDGVKWETLGKIATALLIIGVAIFGFGKVIASLPTDPAQYLAAGVMMVGLMASIWTISKISKKIDMKSLVKGAAAMVLIGAALIPFAFAMSLMEGVSWKTLAIAGVGLVGLALVVAGLGAIMPLILSGALALGAMGLALIPFTFAMSLMEGATWKTLAIAGAGIVGLGIIVSGLGAVLPLILAGVLALGAMGLALIPFTFAMSLMEGVKWENLKGAGKALSGLSWAIIKLGGIMVTGVGALVFGAGILALISLSDALMKFGTALGVVSKNADGVNYLASSLSMLAQSMQELAGVNDSLNDIKPVLKTIHKIETASVPAKVNEPATVTATETKQQSMKFDELINQIKLLRKDVQRGMTMDGKKVSRAIANTTGN